ncbi:hypothetical protein ACMAY7_10635 [Rhodobacteraceae bacterium nBUS_24]
MTLLTALQETSWEITLLAGAEFYDKLQDLSCSRPFECLELNDCFDFEIVPNFDLVLILNPVNWSEQFINQFLAYKDIKFGIGVFADRLYRSRFNVTKLSRLRRLLYQKSSYVYVSDVDFINLDNILVKKITEDKKITLVIPFKFTQDIIKKPKNDRINIVISGNVQQKRRRYFYALFAIIITAIYTRKKITLTYNGRGQGIYSSLLNYFSQCVSSFIKNLDVLPISTTRLSEAEYKRAVLSGTINLLPLSNSFYKGGKDCGAYYDAIEYGLVNVVPKKYSEEIGSFFREVDYKYGSFMGLTSCLIKLCNDENYCRIRAEELRFRYGQQNLYGYVNEQLHTIYQN